MEQSIKQECYVTPSNSFNGDAENEGDRKLFWVPDEEVTNCPSCNVLFNVRVRKHHCRACGKVFCSNCSDNKIKISEYLYAEKVRVCDRCFMERSTSHSLLLQEDLGARKQINQDLKKALTEKMAIVERFKTFLLEFESEILNNTSHDINHTTHMLDTYSSTTIHSNESGQNNKRNDKNDANETREDAECNSAVTNTTGIASSGVNDLEASSDHKDIVALLKKSERGLKLLNERIKKYNITIETQKKELQQLKKEKEMKEELAVLLKKRNAEMQHKNQNISNLLMEKNNLVSIKDEYENVIDTHKKQIQQLIIRCNTLEVQLKQHVNKKKSKKWKLKDHVKNIESTKTPSTQDTSTYWNSFQTLNSDIYMSHTIAEGLNTQTTDENCCSRCQRRMCHIM